jgi:hypothetical protein
MKRFLLKAYFSERVAQAYHQINGRPITLKNHHTGVNAVVETSTPPFRSRPALPSATECNLLSCTSTDPFNVEPADWTLAVNEWVGYMQTPLLELNGNPRSSS